MLPTKDLLSSRDTDKLQVRGWKKIFHRNRNQKKTRVAILLLDKTDFKIQSYYTMIKGSIQQEDITITNIHAPNTEAPQNIRQLLTAIKGETEKNTVILGDFNTALNSNGQTIQTENQQGNKGLNDALDQMDLLFIEHRIPKQQNTDASQVNTVHSPG